MQRCVISLNKTYLFLEGPFIFTKPKGLLAWRKRYKLMNIGAVSYTVAGEVDQNFVDKDFN